MRLQRKKFLPVVFLLVLFAVLGLAAVELARPGLARGKLYTAYFVAKAATWEWEYPSGMPDLRAVDRLMMAVLAPEVARKPAKTWPEAASMPQPVYLPSSPGSLPPGGAQAPLLESGSDWKHLEVRSEPGAGWRALAYDDSAWGTVAAPYGLALLEASTRYVGVPVTTRYFRRAFLVEDPSIYSFIDLELMGGDGAIVYLNGVEVYRRNLPAGEITFQTAALEPLPEPYESTYFHQSIDASLLRPGQNVVAVALHPAARANPESRFDLVIRGALLEDSVRFAVIGDFGAGGPDAEAVAELVKGWDPYFIVTTGDNNYPAGEARTIDRNVGQFYHDYIAPYYGRYGPGADQNRFFPIDGQPRME